MLPQLYRLLRVINLLNNKCPKNKLELDEMRDKPYASTVGSLMYAQVCTCPDLAHVSGLLDRYQKN